MRNFIVVFIVSLTLATSANALDIQVKVEEAIVEYNNGNIGKSANLFGEIADYLRAEKAKKLSVFLPAAPEGWVAEESKNLGSSFMGGGSNTSKKYTKGAEEIEVNFLTDNQLMKGLEALAALGKTDSSAKSYEGNSYEFEKDKYSEDYGFNISLGEGLSVSIDGKTLTEELALEFMKGIKLAELKAAAAK